MQCFFRRRSPLPNFCSRGVALVCMQHMSRQYEQRTNGNSASFWKRGGTTADIISELISYDSSCAWETAGISFLVVHISEFHVVPQRNGTNDHPCTSYKSGSEFVVTAPSCVLCFAVDMCSGSIGRWRRFSVRHMCVHTYVRTSVVISPMLLLKFCVNLVFLSLG